MTLRSFPVRMQPCAPRVRPRRGRPDAGCPLVAERPLMAATASREDFGPAQPACRAGKAAERPVDITEMECEAVTEARIFRRSELRRQHRDGRRRKGAERIGGAIMAWLHLAGRNEAGLAATIPCLA